MKNTLLASAAIATLIAAVAIPALAAPLGPKQAGQRPGGHGPSVEHLLKELDADGNGAISLDEVKQHRAEVFTSIDTDNSGALSEQEFAEFRKMQDAKRMEARQEMMAANGTGDRGAGFGMHAPGKGQGMGGGQGIGKQGMGKQGMGKQGKDHGPSFAWLDADKGGSISLEEFTASAERMFSRFDRNSDGEINAADFDKRRASAN